MRHAERVWEALPVCTACTATVGPRGPRGPCRTIETQRLLNHQRTRLSYEECVMQQTACRRQSDLQIEMACVLLLQAQERLVRSQLALLVNLQQHRTWADEA